MILKVEGLLTSGERALSCEVSLRWLTQSVVVAGMGGQVPSYYPAAAYGSLSMAAAATMAAAQQSAAMQGQVGHTCYFARTLTQLSYRQLAC